MFSFRPHVFPICLAVALAWFAFQPTTLSAQEVELIFGSGFKPRGLEEGSRPRAGTVIEADAQTIVVLKQEWSAKAEYGTKFCVDWLILRGRSHEVQTLKHGDCPERGRGNELGRAMAGESLVGRLTVLGFSSPRADDLDGDERVASLLKNLETLRRRSQPGPQEQRPIPFVAANVSGETELSHGSDFLDDHIVVDGIIKNIGPKHFPCLKVVFGFDTSQGRKQGFLMIRDLGSGEKRSYSKRFPLADSVWHVSTLTCTPAENDIAVAPPPPRPRPTPTPKATGGLIRARLQTSTCLHRKLNDWNNGNPVHLWSCAAGNASMKTWRYDRSTGQISSTANPAKCWHKKFGNWNNGNPIHLWDCKAGPAANKTWTYDPTSGLIRARGNRAKCIHKKEAGFGNGNPVHLWDCNAGVADFKTWIVNDGP